MLGSSVEGILHDMPEDALKSSAWARTEISGHLRPEPDGDEHSLRLHDVLDQPFERHGLRWLIGVFSINWVIRPRIRSST
jgi:hypothetical protein